MMIDSFKGPYSWLSNFAPAPVVFEGMCFRTVEHAYQAAKTNVLSERERFLKIPLASSAKRAGRHVTLRPDWETVKLHVMLVLLRQKFAVEPWRDYLLNTGDAQIVEGNYWHDTFWGVCNGVGENHLGRLLMQVRSELLLS